MITISDLIVAAKAVKISCNARKQGARVEIIPGKPVPAVDFKYWSWTPEAHLPFPEAPKGTREAVKAVFSSLNEGTQHDLTFSPDYFPDRVRFWQQHLKPALTPKQYNAAILTIVDWGKRCVQYRIGMRPYPWIDKQEVQHG